MRSLASIAALACITVTGCSGAAVSPLLEDLDGVADGGLDSSDHPDAPGHERDSSTKPDRSSSDDATNPDDGTSPEVGLTDHTEPKDTGSDASEPPPPVYCGTSSCAVPANECCVDAPYGGTPTYECKSTASSCDHTPVSCDQAADCPGQVCCGTKTGTGTAAMYTKVACEATCTSTDSVRFCGSDSSKRDKCPPGYKCMASVLLGGYYVCDPS